VVTRNLDMLGIEVYVSGTLESPTLKEILGLAVDD